MATLLVDLGNSCLKYAWLRDGAAHQAASLKHRETALPELLTRHWSGMQMPQRVFAACVAKSVVREQFVAWLSEHWDCQLEFLNSPARGSGLVNSYAEPARLGSDRWAAMVAARHQAAGAFCVVDCGSAVTLDVVNESGHHQGGLILPGMQSMLQSLASNTALKMSEFVDSDTGKLGTSTQSAIQSGIVGAIAALVNRTVTEQQQSMGTSLQCFVTGGDAARISHLLNIPYLHQANLVLDGLAILAQQAS